MRYYEQVRRVEGSMTQQSQAMRICDITGGEKRMQEITGEEDVEGS